MTPAEFIDGRVMCCCQTSWTSSRSSATSASIDAGEFELVKDNSVKLASSYNWDQSCSTSTGSLDPNSDDFFNSMLADDKKVSYS